MEASIINSDTVFHRNESTSLSRLGPDEGIMVAFEAGVYVRLNESAIMVWELVDGATPVSALVDRYAAYFSLPVEQAQPDVVACLQELLSLQVIHG